MWSKDQGKYAKEQAEYAKSEAEKAAQAVDSVQDAINQAEQVASENKTRFLNAVATVALRDSTYPKPAHGDTVRVTSTATTYRFVTGSGWVKTDEYNPTAIDEVTKQLADEAQQRQSEIVRVDLALEKTTTEVSNLQANKAEKVFVDSINSRVDGIDRGYGGTYATLANLQTAFPTGDAKRYVVSADGHWYYWNGTVWADGGVFQSTGIGDGTVTTSKLAPDTSMLIDSKIPRIELVNILPNPNFDNTINWFALSATRTVANNEMTIMPTARLGNAYGRITTGISSGDKIYMSASIQANNANVKLEMGNDVGAILLETPHSGSGAYERLSTMGSVPASASYRFRIIDYSTSGWSPIKVKEAVCINLTALFGAGNEPSLADLEARILANNGGNMFFNPTLLTDYFIAFHPKVNFNNLASKSELEDITNKLPLLPKPLNYVKISKGTINVISKYSHTHDFRWLMQRKGPNNLFDFHKIFKIANVTNDTSDDTTVGELFYESFTDWLGPYRVKAIANIDGDNIASNFFTGGNHGYDNSGTVGVGNTPTAKCVSLKFFVDGREVTEFEGYCSTIDIYWTNMVQAMNTTKSNGTGREVLKEDYQLHFDGYKFDVRNTIEFLEACEWITYYGIQCNRSSWKEKLIYRSSANRKWNDATLNSTSIDKNTNIITFKNANGDYLDMAVNNNVDLGRLNLLNDRTYNAYSLETKTYYHLVNNAMVQAGDVFTMEGYYRFYSK